MKPSKAELLEAVRKLKLWSGCEEGSNSAAYYDLLSSHLATLPDEPAPSPTKPEGLVAGLRQVHERHLWAQPGDEPDRVFILRFSDPDCRDQLFTGKDAEARAVEAWNLYSPNWNVYLFGTMPMLSPVSDQTDTVRVKREDALDDTPLERCHADRDGDCNHPNCPQLRDNEPHTTGRHCPIDTWKDADQ